MAIIHIILSLPAMWLVTKDIGPLQRRLIWVPVGHRIFTARLNTCLTKLYEFSKSKDKKKHKKYPPTTWLNCAGT